MVEDNKNDVDDVVNDGFNNTKEQTNANNSYSNTSMSIIDSERDAPPLVFTEVKINYDLYMEFSSLLDIKYSCNEEMKASRLQSDINSVFQMGLKMLRHGLETASSTSLLFNGKPPRTEVMQKLATIGCIFSNQYHYPHFNPRQIVGILKVVLGDVDPRTKQKYVDCIKDNSVKNMTYGTHNVESFYQQIPLHYMLKAKQEIESKW